MNAKITYDNLEPLPIFTDTKISDLDIVLECTSSKYGTCYLPVIDEMCTGFDPTKVGTQTITVTYRNLTATFNLSVVKPTPSPPSDLKGYAPSVDRLNDGKITGTSTTMEYRHEDDMYYTTCVGNTIENLTSGVYYVRYRESTTHTASDEVKVVVPIAGTESHYSYLSGYTDDTFRPNSNMLRSEVAAMFYNLMDDKDTVVTELNFTDLPQDAWYLNAVLALAEQGVVSGYADGTFRPDDSITRAEFVSMAVAFSGVTPLAVEVTFTDVIGGGWYFDSLQTALAYGWVSGYSDGAFRPNNAISRAEVATITNRMLNRSPDKAFIDANSTGIKTFRDLNNTHWAYYEIVEATTSHSAFMANLEEIWAEFL